MKNNKDLLIEELNNYIQFLGSELSNLALFASNHHYFTPIDVIEKGVDYRKRIDELNAQIGNEINLISITKSKGKKYNLFLDDERNPKDVFLFLKEENNPLNEFYDELHEWVVIRTYKEFINYISTHGIPELISFDHDLADFSGTEKSERTGLDCAKWLGEIYMNNPGLPMFEYLVHSKNGIGKDNIYGYLENLRKFYLK